MARTKFSFWSDAADEEYFVVKLKKGTEELTAINAIHDHISNSIYQVLGVCTANLYIGYYQKMLALISKVLPGYKDLIEWLNNKNALEEIEQYNKVDEFVNGPIKNLKVIYQLTEKKVYLPQRLS